MQRLTSAAIKDVCLQKNEKNPAAGRQQLKDDEDLDFKRIDKRSHSFMALSRYLRYV